ncbi:suppressor of fused domain protein [Krasilnikovia sp. MM14-A1259]|uniref:suppressor of fused domain protein n=1 Tax=Krasilnikovia sp. MM14-A1259 TaxID=3373539 RepID=UPI00381B538A
MRLPNDDVDRLADYLEEQVAAFGAVHRMSLPHRTDLDRKLGVMEVADCPKPGVTTWCTFGLAHHDFADGGSPRRSELVSALRSPDLRLDGALADLAFTMMDRGFAPRHGATVGQAISMQDDLQSLAERMPHVVIVHPYAWGGRFVSTETGSGTVWLHQVQPIYDAERRFIVDKGFDTFEEILEAKGVSLTDPDRPCSVRY